MLITDSTVYNELCFQYFWTLICITNSLDPHKNCLHYGCSRETLSWWVKDACDIEVQPGILRRTLMIAVERKMATMFKSRSGYTCFKLNNKIPTLVVNAGRRARMARIEDISKIKEILIHDRANSGAASRLYDVVADD
jgi:hypothetical protein